MWQLQEMSSITAVSLLGLWEGHWLVDFATTDQNWRAHVYLTHSRVDTWCLHTSKSRLFLEPQGSRGHQHPEGTFYFTSGEPLWILNHFTHPHSLHWDGADFPFRVFPRLNYGRKHPLLWLFCRENDAETETKFVLYWSKNEKLHFTHLSGPW